MSDYNVSLVPRKEWNGGFIMTIEVTNTGGEPITDFYVDISTTSATLLKSWDGSHEDLGDGIYRLTFDEAVIEPGEVVTMEFKARGDDDIELVGTSEPDSGSDPTTEPAPEPISPTPVPEPDPGGTEISVSSDTTAAELQALIDGAAEGTVLRLEAGQYSFDSTIQLDRDGVSVVGAGAGETVIDVSGLGQEAFSVGTGNRSGDYTLERDVSEGGSVIELTGSHSFEAGDYVYLARESTEAFYDEIGDTSWRNTDVPLRTSIVQVESVDGNTLTLAGGVHFDFTTGETTVQEIDMAEGVALGGFTVDYGLGTADPSNFENTLSEYDRDAVIQVEGTAGLQLFDVTAHDVPSLGVNVALSTDASVDSIEMTGAHNKGAGGNGYALQIRDVYDSSFTNLVDQDMRHSVVFASWRSSADNMVHVSSTDRDINFHGGRDHGNVVMVDESIRDAESDVISPTLFVNTEGTHYGTVTDADANTALFGHVVGSRRADDVQGYDTGAYLDGAGGNDTLTGGAGNDMLIGGEGDDRLIGGGGEDIAGLSGSRADYDVSVSGGTVQVDEVNGYDTDTLEGVEWVLFSDAALRLSDMSWHDPSATDGVFSGAGRWDPASWDYLVEGTTSSSITTSSYSTEASSGDTASTSDGPVLYGTDGKDVFAVDQAGAVVHGLGNWDVVKSSVDFTMLDDVEKLELTGTAAIEGTGSSSADLILGNDALNVLRGKGGDDRIWGRDGDDRLRGGLGSDELDGQSGDDIVVGGDGADLLTGGAGADLFVLRKVSDSSAGAADHIFDFGDGADRIDLSGIDADTTLSGDQAFHLGGSGPGRLWLDSGSLLGDVDGDDAADLSIDLGGASVTESDFIL